MDEQISLIENKIGEIMNLLSPKCIYIKGIGIITGASIVAEYVFLHEPIFTIFYYKRRHEGKAHRVAISHVAKKLIRVIYKLETSNTDFDNSKIR